MRLSKLIENLDVIKVVGDVDHLIDEIQIDSNAVTKNSLFVCLKGRDFDGHNYVKQIENYGALAIITEREVQTKLTQVIVNDSRKALSQISSAFYGHPEKNLKIIGVTGTNGKTTTCHLIYNILKNSGKRCGLIGTLGTFYGERYIEPNLTTPDPIDLFRIFADMVNMGINIVVMEASAHALYLDKLYGVNFEVGVFTNFTQDHLDFFADMNEYKKAKKKLFKENECKFIVASSDDSVGREILQEIPRTITYGIDNPSDVFAINVNVKRGKQSFVINLFDCIYNVNLNLIGIFNVYNALAACTVCSLLGVPVKQVVSEIERVKGVSGRLECVHCDSFSVYVDYAHTPDGIEKTLFALKKVCENRLITVFGCGGNRDAIKRPIMGKIVGEISDFCIITSDNPRFEEPMDIIFEIEKGVREKTKNYLVIQDREEAIFYAITHAREGDIVLISGKGSERYQEVLGIKKPYNDKDTVEKILGENF